MKRQVQHGASGVLILIILILLIVGLLASYGLYRASTGADCACSGEKY